MSYDLHEQIGDVAVALAGATYSAGANGDMIEVVPGRLLEGTIHIGGYSGDGTYVVSVQWWDGSSYGSPITLHSVSGSGGANQTVMLREAVPSGMDGARIVLSVVGRSTGDCYLGIKWWERYMLAIAI